MDCPRCGTPMEGGVCPNCGFPVIRIIMNKKKSKELFRVNNRIKEIKR